MRCRMRTVFADAGFALVLGCGKGDAVLGLVEDQGVAADWTIGRMRCQVLAESRSAGAGLNGVPQLVLSPGAGTLL